MAPDLLFVHLDLIDAAGHASGWGSAEYLAAIATADALVGRLLDAVAEVNAASGGGLGNVTVVVSSDHGGDVRSHGDDRLQLRSIPLIVAGARAARGGVISREVVRKRGRATRKEVWDGVGAWTPCCAPYCVARPARSFAKPALCRVTRPNATPEP